MKTFSSVSLAVCLLSSLVSAAIDNSTFALISRYEQYAAASYCDSNNQANNSQKITCTDMNANNCPAVQAANSTVRFAFNGAGKTYGAKGFVAQDDTFHQIVVSFRGSNSGPNARADAAALLSPLIAPSAGFTCGTGCFVTEGFFPAYLEYRDAILDAVRIQKQRNRNYTIAVTGHSFGGSLAHYAAIDLRRIYGSADLATYGAVRPGNQVFANTIQAAQTNPILGRNFRVVHKGDIAPRTPGASIIPSRSPVQSQPFFFINATNIQNQNASTIFLIDAKDAPVADDPPLQATLGDPHAFYLNIISACAPPASIFGNTKRWVA